MIQNNPRFCLSGHGAAMGRSPRSSPAFAIRQFLVRLLLDERTPRRHGADTRLMSLRSH